MAHKRRIERSGGWALALILALILAGSMGLSALAADGRPQVAQDLAATATQSAIKQRALQATLTAQARPATPTHTPTPTSTTVVAPPPATPKPTQAPAGRSQPAQPAAASAGPLAQALVRGLNIRAGPGTGYAIIANATAGQSLPVTGQAGGCAWLQVTIKGGSGWISGAPAFSSLNVPCSTLRVVSAPLQAAPHTAVQAPPAQGVAPTPNPHTVQPASPLVAAPVGPGLITGFEPLGSWRRGDEAYGTLAQSAATVHSGGAAAELTYDFPAAAGSRNYVVFLPQPALRIPDGATSLHIYVHGDGSGNFLNTWVADSTGAVWQFTFGRINHNGWTPMTTTLTPNRTWPNGPIGAVAADQLTPPLYVKALVLDGAQDGVDSSGVIYLDDLSGF